MAVLLFVPSLLLVCALGGSRKETASLRGLVHSPAGPAAGARIRCRGEPFHTISDSNGRFALPAPKRRTRVTAAREGYFIAGAWSDADPLMLRLNPLPPRDFEEYAWVDPSPSSERAMACANCHGAIDDEWRSSGHARAGSNSRFLNLYEGSAFDGRPDVGWSLLREHPDGAGVCASCHTPTLPVGLAADYDLREAVRSAGALSGVHCDYCHKVAGPAPGEIGLTHGRFGLQLLRPQHGQLFFGPLDDVDRGDDAYSPFQHDSRFCASCHEGTIFGVAAYTTYSEWRASPAARQGKQCQDCHMTPSGKMTNFAPGRGGIERDPQTLANHRFFDESQAAMLRRSFRVSLSVEQRSDELHVCASVVADNIGHRAPTGFVDRNIVMVIEAYDADGRTIPLQAGPRLPSMAGPGAAGRGGRLYARLLRAFDGKSPVPLWRADPEVIDTRLRPGIPDESRYLYPTGTARLEARLLYRRFWPEVAAEKGWPDNEIEVVRRSWP